MHRIVIAAAVLIPTSGACSDEGSPGAAQVEPDRSEAAGDGAVWLPSTRLAAYGFPPVADPIVISASSSSFTAHVMRLGCSGGVTGTVLAPDIDVTDAQVVVTFQVDAVRDDVPQLCPGNDFVRYEVELGEPIRQRELVDGACGSGEAASTLFCLDDGLRWSPVAGAMRESVVEAAPTTTVGP